LHRGTGHWLTLADVHLTNGAGRRPTPPSRFALVTSFEIRYGIELLPRIRRRASLEAEFERFIEDDIQHRIVPFDAQAATVAAGLMAQRQRTGRIGDLRDTMIAGIVIASHAMLATRNMRHFDDLSVPVVDPWAS
jgi:hypothetical protein